MTGGRIKKMKKFINKDEDFMFTYDGVSNVNLKKLISFHKRNKKMITVTAVRPPARFGEITLKKIEFQNLKKNPKFPVGG